MDPIIEKLWELLTGLPATVAASATTGANLGVWTLVDLGELLWIGSKFRKLSFAEGYLLEVFEEELVKAIESNMQHSDEEDRELARTGYEAAKSGKIPHDIDGSFGLWDQTLLAGSFFEISQLGIPQELGPILIDEFTALAARVAMAAL